MNRKETLGLEGPVERKKMIERRDSKVKSKRWKSGTVEGVKGSGWGTERAPALRRLNDGANPELCSVVY